MGFGGPSLLAPTPATRRPWSASALAKSELAMMKPYADNIGAVMRMRESSPRETVALRYVEMLRAVSGCQAAFQSSRPQCTAKAAPRLARPASATPSRQQVPTHSGPSRPASATPSRQQVPTHSGPQSAVHAVPQRLQRPTSAPACNVRRHTTAQSRAGSPQSDGTRSSSPRPPKKTIRELRAKLDASYAPAMLDLRTNSQNLRKRMHMQRHKADWSPGVRANGAVKPERSPREQLLHHGILWELDDASDAEKWEKWKKRSLYLFENGDLCYESPKAFGTLEVLLDQAQIAKSEICKIVDTENEFAIRIKQEGSAAHCICKIFASDTLENCKMWMQVLHDVKFLARNELDSMAVSSALQKKIDDLDRQITDGKAVRTANSAGPRASISSKVQQQSLQPNSRAAAFQGQQPRKTRPHPQHLFITPSSSSSSDSVDSFPSRIKARAKSPTRVATSLGPPKDQQRTTPMQYSSFNVAISNKQSKATVEKMRSKTAPLRSITTPLRSPTPTKRNNRKTVRANSDDVVKSEKEEALERELSHNRKDRIAGAFSRLSEEGEIHRDNMELALDLVGFQEPVSEYIDETFRALSAYNTLDYGEFIKFVRLYDDRQFEDYVPVFNRYDTFQIGIVETSSIDEMLLACHQSFANTALKDLIHDSIDDFKLEDGVRLNEFRRVVDVLRMREGFSSFDHERLREVFKRYDRNRKGKISTQDLYSAITWLAFSQEYLKKVEQIVMEVDIGADGNRTGFISENEFIVCFRKVREHDDHIIADFVEQVQNASCGRIGQVAMLQLLRQMGYMPDQDAIREALVDAGLRAHESFTFRQLFCFLDTYRKREGLTREEFAEIDVAFGRYRQDNTKFIKSLDIGKVLRWMGYLTPWDVQQKLVAEVDVDHSGKLRIECVRKVVRKFREREMHTLKRTFHEFDQLGHGYIRKSEARRAFLKIGCSISSCELTKFLRGDSPSAEDKDDFNVFSDDDDDEDDSESDDEPGDTVNLHQFVHIATMLRQQVRMNYRDSAGYTKDEVSELRVCFEKYDTDRSGDIAGNELRFLLQEQFPELASSVELRPQLLKLVEPAHHGQCRGFDFPDFLRLMRQFHDLQERERMLKEQRAIESSSFSPAEVEEFRELFIGGNQERTKITFSELNVLINRICHLDSSQVDQLADVFSRSISEDSVHKGTLWEDRDEDHSKVAHFPEFLLIMRHLLDMNFANIRDVSYEEGSKHRTSFRRFSASSRMTSSSKRSSRLSSRRVSKLSSISPRRKVSFLMLEEPLLGDEGIVPGLSPQSLRS